MVVVDGNNRNVEKQKQRTKKKKKKGNWESEKLFFAVERASLPSSSLNIHDLRAGNQYTGTTWNNLLNNERGKKYNYVTNQ